VSDLAAFVAIDKLCAGPEAAIAGLKVAVAGAEVPAELIDRADVVLAGPPEAVAMLRALADRLGG